MLSSHEELTHVNGQIQDNQELIRRLSKEKCDEIYSLAYKLYQHKQYVDASIFFRLLILSSCNEKKFWKGLGACMQMQQDYEEALDCYCVCATLCDEQQRDPYLYTQTADCYFALKQVDKALQALEGARSIALKLSDKRVLQHVNLMEQVWKKTGSS